MSGSTGVNSMIPVNMREGVDGITPAAQKLKNIIYKISQWINSFGVMLLLGMMLLMVLDVTLRRLFNRPIIGTFEIVQFVLVIVVYLGVGYAAVQKAHINVELITMRFSEKTQVFIESITLFLCFGLFGLITWRNILRANEIRLADQTSTMLSIPTFPFYYILALGCGILSIVFLVQLIEALYKTSKLYKKKLIVVLFFVACLIVILPFLFSLHIIEWELKPMCSGIIGIIALLFLMAARMPIGFAMGFVGLMGYWFVVGVDAGFSLIETTPFSVGSDYLLSVIPLFLLMGQFAFCSGISQELYDTSYKWLGQYPGGLAMATIGGCAAFGAVSGSGVATAATMGSVSLPGMKKYKYSDKLALGSVAAGGSIGLLIPPSIVFILYGILTEQSIGTLFMAGILPGLLTVVLYISTIMIIVRINPNQGPPGPKTTFFEKILSLRNTWAMVVLFILVMGGIYIGYFTPTEAGAVGAFGAFVFALIRRKLTWKKLQNCLLETGQTTAMLIIIFVGAQIFNYFLAVTNLPMDLADKIGSLGLNKYLLLVVILAAYLIMGCIMDAGSMIILSIPIVFPLIQSQGFDPIWFGVIIVMVASIGAITPPVGLNVFVIKGVAKDVPISEIYKGILPFWLADMVRLVLVIILPQIALLIPNLFN